MPTPAPTHPTRSPRQLSRGEPASTRALRIRAMAIRNTLDSFTEFLCALSVADYYPDETNAFDAACEMHADAVAMLPGGPWVAPMPFDCVEPEGAVTR